MNDGAGGPPNGPISHIGGGQAVSPLSSEAEVALAAACGFDESLEAAVLLTVLEGRSVRSVACALDVNRKRIARACERFKQHMIELEQRGIPLLRVRQDDTSNHDVE